MLLRREIAQKLNELGGGILRSEGRELKDPMNLTKAGTDPGYNHCGDSYNIVAGAPANFHNEPCLFEVDAVKEGGPFTDPATGDGYPNYSFFIPGEVWMPGLLDAFQPWLEEHRGKYDVFVHPNTGCEVCDHAETQSARWFGKTYPLLSEVFSCNSLGCNQACPKNGTVTYENPPDCHWHY
jgi:hypothetical protein